MPRDSFPIIHDTKYNFSIDKIDLLKDGIDKYLIGIYYCSNLILQTAALIEKKLNKSVKIINLSTIKSINEENLISELKNIKNM